MLLASKTRLTISMAIIMLMDVKYHSDHLVTGTGFLVLQALMPMESSYDRIHPRTSRDA